MAVKNEVNYKNEKIIEIANITKVFGNVTVVDNISLAINRGEFVTLLGPSGCGKTTLLRMIGGFETPTSGTITLEGKELTSIPPEKRPINTVFQKYALFPHYNVFNNVAYGLKNQLVPNGEKVNKDGSTKQLYRHYTKKEIEEKVNRALKVVGLEDYGYRSTNTLSGGQQQRVAIARAIVLEPKVLLLDEPLGALDLKMRKEMQLELKRLHEQIKITFIYVTHDQEEALTMSDTIVVINDGAIQQVGTPKMIYDEPANAFVANFIGESNLIPGTMPSDKNVTLLGSTIPCLDKGFAKNEPVDVVIRPEDIQILASTDSKAQFTGTVKSEIFKGTYYEMEIDANGYEFTVQSTSGHEVDEQVGLYVEPNGIHIMKKLRTINEFYGEVDKDNLIWMCKGDFDLIVPEGLEKGDRVKISVPFNAVELTDDEEDGVIGANVTQSIYKGTYYQVQVYTDTDEDFFVDTPYEWDINDRVGIKLNKELVMVEKYEEEEEE